MGASRIGLHIALLGVVLALSGMAITFAIGGLKGNTTRTEFTDKAGRHCTQVGAALDCDYPPAENRIGDALNGLVNP